MCRLRLEILVDGDAPESMCVCMCRYVCALFAGREKFNDNARAVATGEVGPLNQYGGGVPGAPNGGRRRACAVFRVFRGGARRAAPLRRGGRRRTPPPPPPPSSCLRVSTARMPGDLRERSHRRQRTADHDAHTTTVVAVVVAAVVVVAIVVKVVSVAADTYNSPHSLNWFLSFFLNRLPSNPR